MDSTPVEIPHGALSPLALHAVLEEHATRGGDPLEEPLKERIGRLRRELEAGRLRLFFDPAQGTAQLVEASR